MDTLNPVDLAEWTSGEWRNGVPSLITGLSNDTRRVENGQLFVAIRTDARDGHDFLEAAHLAGASGAIVDRVMPEVGFPQLLVADVGAALLAAAQAYRQSWNSTVVGVTGSCGKTTCKDVLACLLSKSATLSTLGNLNNLLGVPMSALRPAGAAAAYAVLEAGISEPGEMQRLVEVIDPDWAVVTAIGPAHLQDLGSVGNVAFEKGKLLQGTRLRGAFVGETAEAFLDALDCPRAIVVKRDRFLSREWAFDHESAVGCTRFKQRLGGIVQEFEYAGTGEGLASNVALAVAVAFSMGLDVSLIRENLKAWRPSPFRNEWRTIGQCQVFLDCYNANPISMRDSLATFVAETPDESPRFYLLGCMEELGVEAARLHEELGRELPLRKQDFLLVIGSEASSVLRGMKKGGRDTGMCFEIDRIEEASERLARFSGSVFLKGSRRYRLESALESLEGGVSC